jgi:serine/threonine protein kinase
MTATKGLLLENRFLVINKIGEGSFGEVFLCHDNLLNGQCVIKCESFANKHPLLVCEAFLYKQIQGFGIPKIFSSGTVEARSFRYMAVEVLGPSLDDLFVLSGNRFSLKTTCMIFYQLIERMQFLHNLDYLHRDIKPNNFLVGLND